MRWLVPPLALATTLTLPAVADASPFAVPLTANSLNSLDGLNHRNDAPETSAPTMGGEAPADAPAPAEDPAPSEDPAPAGIEGPTADDQAIIDSTLGDPTAEGDEEDDELEDELSGPVKKGDFNANAIGLRGGIHLVPSYFLSGALASYANSL